MPANPKTEPRRRRVRLVAALAWIGMVAALVYGVDRVLMHTRFDEERLFLEDVAHRPEPDGVRFNEHGIRDARSASAFAESDFNVVVLGDSFVYGYALESHETIPHRLEQRLRERFPERSINVANFGYLSASPYLSLGQLEDFGRSYRPDLVLLCVDMTDFHDDIKYERYERKVGMFSMLRIVPSAFFAIKDVARRLGIHEAVFGYPSDQFFIVNRPLELTRPHFASLQRNIDAVDRYARRELGAAFALVLFPRQFQYSMDESPHSWERHKYSALGPFVHEPFRYFEEQRPTNYVVGSLLSAFEQTSVFPTAFEDDPHWNADGAGVAVEAILDFLEEEGLLSPLSAGSGQGDLSPKR